MKKINNTITRFTGAAYFRDQISLVWLEFDELTELSDQRDILYARMYRRHRISWSECY